MLLRATREPAGTVMVGQAVHIFADVLFPDEMAYPPRVASPRMEGPQVLRFESQATTITAQLDGRSYIGKRFAFDVYPRRPVTLHFPPFQVTLLAQGGGISGTMTGPGLSLKAIVPPGLDPSEPIVASPDVTLTESWAPFPSGTFHVGDALKRVVTRRATDVPGLALSALDFVAPPGVQVYVDAPVIEDRVEHGAVIGQRTDHVTYVFERSGRTILPGVSQPWWDLQNNEAHSLSVPGRAVTVTSAALSNRVISRGRFLAGPCMLGLPLVLGVVILACAWRHRIVARLSALRAAWDGDERVALRNLERACRTADPKATFRTLQRWIACRVGESSSPQLNAQAAILEGHLFGPSRGWNRGDARRLGQAARLLRRQRHHRKTTNALPPLNPTS
ncbi:hypothetical protein HLH34_00360 [Gluconacetobacter azotocaptans]|uniref:Protein BatD n=1 Tax=Gluconacetobacter azotocaptans TaxID=142834 RepID=A0A7W4JPA7_9PROT|nr:hypothetical protein [Gluconacetobacter azotocaptans]